MNMDDNQRRGIAGIILLVAPIFCVTLVALAYIVLFAYGDAGIAAAGPMARMTFVGCPEAQAVVAARVETMGLPDPQFKTTEDGFQLTSRLPGEQRVVERLPKTLAMSGRLQVRPVIDDVVRDEVLVDETDLEYATVYMAFLDTPRARVRLKPEAAERLLAHQHAHVHQRIAAFVEGKKIGEYRNTSPINQGEFDIDLPKGSDFERMDFAAETAIILDDPLPCPVTLDDVTLLDASL
jgi:hypothetical protein